MSIFSRSFRLLPAVALALGLGGLAAAAPVEKASGSSFSWAQSSVSRGKRNGRGGGQDPNRADRWARAGMLRDGTHAVVAGRMRNIKKLAASVPAGSDSGRSGRGRCAIGVNGIRGASGGNRDRGGACVPLNKRPLRGWRH